MQLSYELTLKNGKRVGVWDERASGGIIDKYVGPFADTVEANNYANDFTEAYSMGYNGQARLTVMNDAIYVACTRWTSCD